MYIYQDAYLSIKAIFKNLVFLTFLFSIQGSFAQEESPVEKEEQAYENPEDFADSLIVEVLNFIKISKELSVAEQEKSLIELSKKYFDGKKICKFILGRHAKQFSEDQFSEFCKYFEILTSKKLVVLLRKTATENIENIMIDFKLTLSKDAKRGRGKIHNLSSSIKISEASSPIFLKLTVLEKENVYSILDINLANISLIVAHRNIYNSMIESKGVDGTLSFLKEKTDL